MLKIFIVSFMNFERRDKKTTVRVCVVYTDEIGPIVR